MVHVPVGPDPLANNLVYFKFQTKASTFINLSYVAYSNLYISLLVKIKTNHYSFFTYTHFLCNCHLPMDLTFFFNLKVNVIWLLQWYVCILFFLLVVLRRLAPEIYCNDIFLKVIFLLTLYNCQPKNVQTKYVIGLVMEI